MIDSNKVEVLETPGYSTRRTHRGSSRKLGERPIEKEMKKDFS